MATTSLGFIEFRKNILLALHAARTLDARPHLRVLRDAARAATPSESAMSPGPHSAKAMPGTFRFCFRVGQRVLVFEFQTQQEFAIGIERPCVGLVQILVWEIPQICAAVGDAVNAAASFVSALLHSLFVDGKPHGFHECATAPGVSAWVSIMP